MIRPLCFSLAGILGVFTATGAAVLSNDLPAGFHDPTIQVDHLLHRPHSPTGQSAELRGGKAFEGIDMSFGKSLKTAVIDAATIPSHRLPGEFEQQQLLLLSCGELTQDFTETIAEIVHETQRHIRTVVLVNDDSQKAIVETAMARWMVEADNRHFFYVTHNSRWIRDFGPLVAVDRRGGNVVIDNGYDGARRDDDLVPLRIAQFKGVPHEMSPLILEGGNVLSNGQGLCIATSDAIHDNSHMSETQLRRHFRKYFGANATVFLEPLAGEGTGHVDVFATFTDAQTVVIGAYDPVDEPENADILDRNANRLAQLHTPLGPLRVVRIPMGSRRGGHWRTYTNCIFANGVLLVPRYVDGDVDKEADALDTYARLLPGWRIVSIDASNLIEADGALHCVSMNVASLRAAHIHQLEIGAPAIPLR